MANVNYIIEFSFSLCIKCCTYGMGKFKYRNKLPFYICVANWILLQICFHTYGDWMRKRVSQWKREIRGKDCRHLTGLNLMRRCSVYSMQRNRMTVCHYTEILNTHTHTDTHTHTHAHTHTHTLSLTLTHTHTHTHTTHTLSLTHTHTHTHYNYNYNSNLCQLTVCKCLQKCSHNSDLSNLVIQHTSTFQNAGLINKNLVTKETNKQTINK